MDLEEFTKRVKEIADARGTIWVSLPLKYSKDSVETIRILFNSLIDCKQCGRCCTGFWFNNVPLLEGDQDKIISVCKSKEEFQEITDLMDFNDKKIVALKESCKFLKENKCSIYQKRPSVCKMFPIMVEDTIIINVCCLAGLELYTKLAVKNNLALDSIGL